MNYVDTVQPGIFNGWFNLNFVLHIYVIVMGIIKRKKVFAGIFIFSSLFKIKMKVFSLF